MALYQDPAAPYRQRPSLVRDLLRIPAKVTNHQIENQATCVLAWLVDRSPVVARELVGLFVGDAVEVVEPIGARTWLSLPKPGGGAVYPDLSIDCAQASLQLLVEVKVGSAFAVFEDGATLQPDYYRTRWLEQPPELEAAARAVGTLTRPGGTTPVDLAALRARDVTWSQVRDLLRALLRVGALDASVALVAASFLEAVESQIAVDPPDPAVLAEWLAAHAGIAHAVAGEVSTLVGGDTIRSISGGAFVGRRIGFDDIGGDPLFARVYAAKAGTGLTLPGWPDAIVVGIERDVNGSLDPPTAVAVQEAGFVRVKDADGYWLHRQFWPLDDADAMAASIADALLATGLFGRRA